MSAARNSCVNPTLPNLKKIEMMGRFEYQNNQSKGSVELDDIVRNQVAAPSESEIDIKIDQDFMRLLNNTGVDITPEVCPLCYE